jgi:hypothetical protein
LENGKKTISPANIDTTMTESNLVMMCWWLKAKIIYSKLGGYTVSLNHNNTVQLLKSNKALSIGYEQLLHKIK